jgi:hypothetical protein
MLKTISLDRKTGRVIEIKTEESREKIDYSGIVNFLAEKYTNEKTGRNA